MYDTLNRRTTALVQELNSFFTANEAPIKVGHFGSLSLFLLYRQYGSSSSTILQRRACIPGKDVPVFFPAAHTEADIDFIIQAVKSSIRDMQEGGFLPGKASPQLLAFPLTGTQQQLWALSQIDRLWRSSLSYFRCHTGKGRIAGPSAEPRRTGSSEAA